MARGTAEPAIGASDRGTFGIYHTAPGKTTPAVGMTRGRTPRGNIWCNGRMKDLIAFLRGKGLRPTTHRVAVARFVFNTSSHPSADEVLNSVRRHCPTISRATVYNALDLFVKKGLLRKRLLKPGAEVFDPLMDAHHHFIDETTGAIFDVPLDACKIQPTAALRGYDIKEYHVVLRGRRRKTQKGPLSWE